MRLVRWSIVYRSREVAEVEQHGGISGAPRNGVEGLQGHGFKVCSPFSKIMGEFHPFEAPYATVSIN